MEEFPTLREGGLFSPLVDWATPIQESTPLISSGSVKVIFSNDTNPEIPQRLPDGAFIVQDDTPAQIHMSDLGFAYLTERVLDEIGGPKGKFFILMLGEAHAIPMGVFLSSRGVTNSYYIQDDFHNRSLHGFKSQARNFQAAKKIARTDSVAVSFDIHSSIPIAEEALPSLEALRDISEVIILEENQFGRHENREQALLRKTIVISKSMAAFLSDFGIPKERAETFTQQPILGEILMKYVAAGKKLKVYGVDPRQNEKVMEPLLLQANITWDNFSGRSKDERTALVLDLLKSHYDSSIKAH